MLVVTITPSGRIAAVPISDRKLARLGREYQQVSEQIKALEARKTEIKNTVLAELDRRGTKAIEADGVRVSSVRQTTVVYDASLAREVLGSAKFKKIVKTVVDPALIAAMQQRGEVTVEKVAEFSSVVPKSAYIAVGQASE